jgi:hypothetical protein
MRGRLNLVEVQLADPVDVLEDPGELARHRLYLLLGEGEARKPRNVQHLIAVDHRAKYAAADTMAGAMRGERAEKFVVLNLRLLATSFAGVGLLFIIFQNGVLDVISDLGDDIGDFTRAPHTIEQFWLALAFAYMMVIAGICLVVQLDVVRYRPLLLVLAAGKSASSLAALGFYLFDQDVFIYLLNFLVDGFLAMAALWLWSLAGHVARPAAPG